MSGPNARRRERTDAASGPVIDARVERSTAKVLAETYRQLSLSGVAGLSIDEIARASGVAKTTIYRHWPTRAALVVDACSRLGSPLAAPDSGDTRRDLLALTTTFAAQLRDSTWSVVHPSIVDAGERDADIRAMQAALHLAFMAPFDAVVARARSRGDIDPARSTRSVVAGLVGPLFYRRWFSRERIDARFIRECVDAVLTGEAIDASPSRRQRGAVS